MAGIDEGIFIRYVFAKLAEAPTLARSYTEIDGKRLEYRRVYFRIRKYVDDFFEGNVGCISRKAHCIIFFQNERDP